jgi:hypothetical protein
MSDETTTKTSIGGLAGRIALTLAGAALMILGSFLRWVGQLRGTDLSIHALYNEKFHHSGHFFTNVGAVMIGVALLAIIGLAFHTGWLTRVAGALGIVVFVLFAVQLYRGPGGQSIGLGAWVALGGSILTLVAGFFRSTSNRVAPSRETTVGDN